MPKTTKKPEIRLTVNHEIHNGLKAIANRRGEALNDVIRSILSEAIAKEASQDGIDYVSTVLRQTMRDILRPVEERLAKINAKTAITSGTAMFMAMQVIEEAGYDSHSVYQQARKKAAAYLAEKEGGD
ncbi:MAG: hypothetical protein H0Z34_10905 [Brevibacillus sp.]|nr:hypothetical protein [Brevibacillus sp.]